MSFRQIQDLIPVSISTWRTWIAGGIVSEPEVRGNNLFWWSDEIRSLIQSFGGKELGFYRVAKVKEIFNYMTDSGVYKAADRGGVTASREAWFGERAYIGMGCGGCEGVRSREGACCMSSLKEMSGKINAAAMGISGLGAASRGRKKDIEHVFKIVKSLYSDINRAVNRGVTYKDIAKVIRDTNDVRLSPTQLTKYLKVIRKEQDDAVA